MKSPLSIGPDLLLSGVLGLGLLGSVACGDSSSNPGTGGAGASTPSTGGMGPTTGGGGSGGNGSGAGASGGSSTLPTDTEGDGDFEVGPDYPMDPDLTDLGAPQGASFSFQMSSADSLIFNGDGV